MASLAALAWFGYKNKSKKGLSDYVGGRQKAYQIVGELRADIAKSIGRKPAPIGIDKAAIRHIISRHGKEMNLRSEKAVVGYVKKVIKNTNCVFNNYGERLMLVKLVNNTDLVIIELVADGDRYEIVTAFRADHKYLNGKELIWIK